MDRIANFRHDPVRMVLPCKSGPKVDWSSEPIVRNYRILTYFNKTLGRSVRVPVSATPVVVPNVGIIVASDDGFIRFFDSSLERIFWELRQLSPFYAPLLLSEGGSAVIVASTKGTVTSIDLKGTVNWVTPLPNPVFATPAIDFRHNLLVVPAFGGCVYGLDAPTGQVRWVRELPKPWGWSFRAASAAREPYASPVMVEDGNTILCCGEHIVSISDCGDELWHLNIGHTVKASPLRIPNSDIVVLCAVDGVARFINVKSGEIIETIELGGKVVASPAISENIIAIGTMGGETAGLSTRERKIIWRTRIDGPREYSSITVLPDGNFAFTGSRGNIVCVNRDDGRFMWETSQVLGLPDHEPTLDITPIASPTGSMFCASYSGFLYHFIFRPFTNEAE